MRLTCLRVTVLIVWQCVREQMCVPSILMFGHSMPLFFIRCRMHCRLRHDLALLLHCNRLHTAEQTNPHGWTPTTTARHQRAFYVANTHFSFCITKSISVLQPGAWVHDWIKQIYFACVRVCSHQLVSGSSWVRMELSIFSVWASLCSSSFSWLSVERHDASEKALPEESTFKLPRSCTQRDVKNLRHLDQRDTDNAHSQNFGLTRKSDESVVCSVFMQSIICVCLDTFGSIELSLQHTPVLLRFLHSSSCVGFLGLQNRLQTLSANIRHKQLKLFLCIEKIGFGFHLANNHKKLVASTIEMNNFCKHTL